MRFNPDEHEIIMPGEFVPEVEETPEPEKK
jgi:hypothetical protein